ncbi:putative 23S rRNA (pseudouridine1915-N3)-methyltransferase [Magnetofaba australis IT-1]|uniref:Ribosomal RNA large subunit methyltransferase H n=2 Tax=Magnetofaba TaxID=1472292 RepID=A0A1Y2K0P7_9PROT|nr:putative 23S rRNA (pseudouridine1915-N3)-methyltransferase [Magnetofaba australis IT-1]
MPRPITQLCDDYAKRLKRHGGLEVIEIPEARADREREAGRRQAMADEAQRLLAKVPDGALVVTLDRGGKLIDSEAFAAQLGRWRDDGERSICFLLGGPDGLDDSVLTQARFSLSFGPMTFPHPLARAMLCEQVYRAVTILERIPYHR